MKIIKSCLALMLALAFVFTLAACGGAGTSTIDNGSGDTSGTGSDDDKWMPVEGANGDPNLRLPKYDLKSNTFRFICTWEWEKPKPNKESAARDVYHLDWSTVVAPPEEELNKFISMVMSGDAPELYIGTFLPSLANKGYIQPWDDFIDFNIGIWQGIKRSIENLAFKGKHYALGDQPGRWDMVWYNKEIFEENGVKTPKEYYEEGNWNWDTFRECAKALTIDSDSNGVPELWGAAIDSTSCFVYTTGKDFITINADGTVTNNIKSPEIARAMQFYIDLCIKDKVIYDGQASRDDFKAGKIAMIVGGAWYRSDFIDLIKARKLWFVPYPKDPQADKYYLYEGFGAMMLGRDCANPEAASAFMCAQRYDLLDTADNPPKTDEDLLESVQWTVDLDDWLWNEFYKDDKYPVLDTGSIFELWKYGGDIWFRPKQGEPWATIAEELAPKIDEDIARALEG